MELVRSFEEELSAFRRTALFGLVPLTMSLMLMAAQWPPGPGLWSALGTTVGLYLLAWSGRELAEFSRSTQTLWTAAFVVRWGWATVTVLLLWNTWLTIGLQAGSVDHLVLWMTLILGPLHRWMRTRSERPEASWNTHRIELLLRYLLRISVTLLSAMVLVNLLREPDGTVGPAGIIPAIAIWVLAVLVILACVGLLIERWITLAAQSKASDTAPPGGS